MAIKYYMVVAFIIAAVPPILLHSASNADNLLQRSSKKYLRDEGTENGYWFSYPTYYSCQKCNCSVTVTTEMSIRDRHSYLMLINLIVNIEPHWAEIVLVMDIQTISLAQCLYMA